MEIDISLHSIVVYGRHLPALSDLQLQGDNVTRVPFFHFTDYLNIILQLKTESLHISVDGIQG